MLRKSLVCLTLVAVFFSALSDADARKRRKRRGTKMVPVVLLPVKAKGLERARARKLAKGLASAMIEELRDIGIFKPLVGKRTKKKMRRLKKKKVYVRNCQDNKKCVRRVGKALGAKVIYHMQLAQLDEGVEVTLRTFDVRSGKKLREAVGVAAGDDLEVERQARWMARKVSGPMITTVYRKKGKGRFKVEGDEMDAELLINGKSFGKRMGKSFKVSPGVFDVVARKDGFEDFHDVVVVKPKQEKIIKAEFKPVDKADRPVVASIVAKGDEPKKDKPKPEVDLPAWAKFSTKPGDKTKPKPKVLIKIKPKPEPKPKPKPFLPPPKPEAKPEPNAEDDDGGAFYTTWWFWTAVGVGVAGAAAATTAVLLTGGESTPDTGGATLQWQ